ncbi:MAG: UDP-glucose--hexose-1-phosphate uridylyltransferase [Candidatus Limnocylindrales bacterium]
MSTPTMSILGGDPHRRFDALGDTWVLVSAGRTKRPWLGARETEPAAARPGFDPECYLCPGTTRANGAKNPSYEATHVFVNDFSALRPDTTSDRFQVGLLRAEGEQGECRVLCFSARHDLSMGAMTTREIRGIIDAWGEQTTELGARHRWVQVFENRGAAMGASNPHPHGQIWAGTALPVQAERESGTQVSHLAATGRPLLLDYAEQESGGPRVVLESAEWQVVVPFWAAWPFETMLIARRPVARLPDLDPSQRDDLAAVLSRHIGGYDRMFGAEFPYSMGWHQAPFGPGDGAGWQLHAHFYPPLLRAGVRKFMVGYELLAETQRDLAPEEAAERLREMVDTVHR